MPLRPRTGQIRLRLTMSFAAMDGEAVARGGVDAAILVDAAGAETAAQRSSGRIGEIAGRAAAGGDKGGERGREAEGEAHRRFPWIRITH